MQKSELRLQTDDQLVALWQVGNSDAAGIFFERHFGGLCRFFANKARGEAADLAQQTCLEFLRSLGDRRYSTARDYLFGIAKNVLRRHYRTSSRGGGRPLEELLDWGSPDSNHLPTPDGVLEAQDSYNSVTAALCTLADRDRIVIDLFYWEGFGSAEIAQRLGVGEHTIRTWISRARLRMKHHLRGREA